MTLDKTHICPKPKFSFQIFKSEARAYKVILHSVNHVVFFGSSGLLPQPSKLTL